MKTESMAAKAGRNAIRGDRWPYPPSLDRAASAVAKSLWERAAAGGATGVFAPRWIWAPIIAGY